MALAMDSIMNDNFDCVSVLTEKERIQNFLKMYPMFNKEGIKVIHLKGRKNRFLVEYNEQVHERIRFSPVLSEKEYYDYCLHTDIDRWKFVYGLHVVNAVILPVHTIHDQESVYWDDDAGYDTTDQDDRILFDFVVLKQGRSNRKYKDDRFDRERQEDWNDQIELDKQDGDRHKPIYGEDYDVEQVAFTKFMVRLIVKK